VRYHYTILDFAARWDEGEPVAGGDVRTPRGAPFDALDRYDLWSEARRIIGAARKLLGL